MSADLISFKNSIARQFIIRILLFSMVITTILTGIQLYVDYKNGVQDIHRNIDLIEDSYLQSITNSSWILDKDAVNLQLDGILKLPDVQYVEIIENGIVKLSRGVGKSNNIIEHQYPFIYHYRDELIPLGEMNVYFSLDGLYRRLFEKVLIIGVSQGIKTLLVSFFIFIIFYLLVGRYLTQIARFSNQLKSHTLDQKLELEPSLKDQNHDDELHQLLFSLNSMREHFLQYQQETASREKALSLFKNQINQSRDSLYLLDPKTARILDVNKTSCHFLGYTQQEMLQKTVLDITKGLDDMAAWKQMAQRIQNAKNGLLLENEQITKSGEIVPVEISAKQVRHGDKQVFVAFARDISERKVAEEKLIFQAQHDQLTLLPNRLLLQDRVEQLIAEADRNKDKVALLFIDLDHFKHINDSYGHAYGDQVLLEVTKRLLKVLRKTDTLSRLGGDEFVALTHISEHQDDAALLAKKLIDALAEPFNLDNIKLNLKMSIGISIYPDDAGNAELLLRNADAAMYKTKSLGRNNFQYYSPELTQQAEQRLRLENEINQALKKEEFMVYYQPQLDFPGERVIGAEALIRWQHPERGLVSPDEFIPLAEQTGQIREIDNWVLSHVCQFISEQERQGITIPKVSVNFSSQELEDELLVEKFCNLLEKHHCPPERIEVEVTESQLMTNPDVCIVALDKLRNIGIGIAIDDFGTGYSSLSYLKKLPITKLKIDRSFVRDLSDGKNDQAIVRAIIALGQSLELELIAEGVETPQQHEFLLKEGCRQVQGFLFSMPLAEEDFLAFLSEHQQA